MWLKDPKTNKCSVTLSLMVTGFTVALIKLLLSELKVGDLSLGVFSGTDFAAVIGSLGAIYAARKHTDKESKEDK